MGCMSLRVRASDAASHRVRDSATEDSLIRSLRAGVYTRHVIQLYVDPTSHMYMCI